MKAIAYTHCHPSSHAEALLDLDLPEPAAPQGRDILVEVQAVSVNPVDAKLRAAADPGGKPRVLGFDACGVVRACGPEAQLFAVGDAVFYAGAVNRPGSNAELHLVDERIVGRKPANLTAAEAAALPLTSITAWEALFDRLKIAREGAGAVLIIGGAGGVGSMAVQLARQRTGLRVITTASRPETREWCLRMGAHDVLDHSGDLVAQAKALGVAIPWIFSTTQTAKHWRALCDIVAPQGALCAIDDLSTIEIGRLKSKAASFHWEGMFARSLFQTQDMIEQHALLNEVARMLETGQLHQTMTRHLGRITAANILTGHALVESGTMIGKAVAEGWA